MKPTIKLLKHVQWGRERLYPGCPLSRAICLALKKKTVSDEVATIFNAVGQCEIEIEIVKKRPSDPKMVRVQ